MEELRIGPCAAGTACIRRCESEVIKVQGFQIRDKDGRSIQMIHRHIKKSLDLISMKVNCNNTVHASGGKQVGNQFGSDGDTGLVFAVLACISEVRDHSYNGTGRSAAGRIDHHKQFKEVI